MAGVVGGSADSHADVEGARLLRWQRPTNYTNTFKVGVIMAYGLRDGVSALTALSCKLDDLGVSYWTGYNSYGFPLLFVNAAQLSDVLSGKAQRNPFAASTPAEATALTEDAK